MCAAASCLIACSAPLGGGANADSGTGGDSRVEGDGPAFTDGSAAAVAALRLTEINPAGSTDLIELVAVRGGRLSGLRLKELTNSGLSYAFPDGYQASVGDVIVLHVGGSCSDSPANRASCGDGAPFSASAWDFSTSGGLSYSGKVFELLAPDQTPVDGVPFVESHGTEPANYVAAVQQLQRDRVWPASPPCVDDPATGLAKDRYCRNIAVLWDSLSSDGSDSVQRIAGAAPLDVPGAATQWSARLPASWGGYR